MARTAQDITEAELRVLQTLWDRGPSTRRALADGLYPENDSAAYTTVQKLLERLKDKGYVSSERGNEGLTFVAAVDRQELIGRRLKAMADKLCEGSLTPLLTSLIQTQQLTAQEVQELRDLLDELKQANRTKGKRR
jgi:predicted transcriptional regulator